MKIFLNKILSILFFVFIISSVNIGCDGNDNEPELPKCTQQGLHYRIDGGQEIFLPSNNQGININYLENGNYLMVHQLGNGFIFQSNETDVGQTSTHNNDLTIAGSSKLDIPNLWSNTDTVNITYRCDELNSQVDGDVYYSFSGTFQSGTDPQKEIEGYICVKIHEIR
jgi:hypothetical protein